MKALSQEWVDKAEADWTTARREFTAEDRPNYDAVCFHAQQCVKKYLLARMEEADIPFPATHHLGVLLSICTDFEPSWEELKEAARTLTAHTIQIVHPGIMADEDMAHRSLDSGAALRRSIRESLELGD
ncbi:MAG TPA: HEPN domain-containing protein [Holophagaceae bacterium]|jgi:HEPN domain-containing protein|nr:HEPN domain-containing protein [Holophagaceae bacterium]